MHLVASSRCAALHNCPATRGQPRPESGEAMLALSSGRAVNVITCAKDEGAPSNGVAAVSIFHPSQCIACSRPAGFLFSARSLSLSPNELSTVHQEPFTSGEFRRTHSHTRGFFPCHYSSVISGASIFKANRDCSSPNCIHWTHGQSQVARNQVRPC